MIVVATWKIWVPILGFGFILWLGRRLWGPRS
jgi:hypothetical protein